ncbi:MAG: threonine--tRNA ligase, partial [Oligoflexia bacterium]|nr:threonine--tRNA ligase [Oligoflexia bacterium]
MNCRIQLPDGNFKEFESCPTALEVAFSISSSLAEKSVAVLVNQDSELKDIRSVLQNGDQIEIITLSSEKSLEVIRHSSAHVLAQAVQNLWPEVKVTIGPVIENGFYYDFDTDKKFTPEDLNRVEQEMKSLLEQKYELKKEVWPSEKACLYFERQGELLKKEIIEDLGEKEVSIYRQGPWLDLCRGPHVQHLGQIGAVKVLSHSGAYWRGDSSKKQLQRIYGTAFHTEKQLKVFLKKREEAMQNDHRLLGKKLNLFYFNELSAGSPFFTPLGTRIYRSMQRFLEEKYREYGYQEVITPQIYHSDLFQTSGHLNHYSDNMFAVLEREQLRGTGFKHLFYQEEKKQAQEKTKPVNMLRFGNTVLDVRGSIYDDNSKFPQAFSPKDNQMFRGVHFLKPMNCPGHCLLYKKDRWSYKKLPWRVADFGRLHRRESTGALQGLTRVKSFCQDDAHVFCRLEQLSQEIQNGIQMLQEVYKVFGLTDYKIELSTRPDDRMGEDSLWDKAELALSSALEKLDISYEVQKGEGAFYGPKLDVSVKDAFDRSWQLGTFQCDFNLPRVFDLSYINEKDKEERPVLLHRAILGSLERFFAVYLE